MRAYEIGVITGTPTASQAYVVLWNPNSAGPFRLCEAGIVAPSPAVTNVQLWRVAGRGTASTSPALGSPNNQDNPNDVAPLAVVDTAWSTQPTIYSGSVSPIRITSFPTNAPRVTWRWERDEFWVLPNFGVTLWNPSSGSTPGVLHVYLRWEE